MLVQMYLIKGYEWLPESVLVRIRISGRLAGTKNVVG